MGLYSKAKMKYIAAYLLASLKKEGPSEKDVKKILTSVGIEVDDDKVKKIVSELKGKSLEEGKEKLEQAGSALGGGGGAGGNAGGDSGAKAEARRRPPLRSLMTTWALVCSTKRRRVSCATH